MGILRETDYWKNVVQQMVPFRPAPGVAPSPEDIQRLLRISCSAFSQLVNDPELPNDLEVLVEAARRASKDLPDGAEALKGYLQAFRRVEMEILRSATVPEDAITELDAAIADMENGGVDWSNYEDVKTKLSVIQKKVCGFARTGNFEGEAPKLGTLLIGAAAGTLIGAADLTVVMGSAAAAVVVAPGIAAHAAAAAAGAGALVGFSLNVPLRSWHNLWKHLKPL